ncbi:unnamed protein product [Pedinophyceae sp. YPF-701]|nr:unnamed protein product [Pedinophyceae sp. YPF-701]
MAGRAALLFGDRRHQRLAGTPWALTLLRTTSFVSRATSREDEDSEGARTVRALYRLPEEVVDLLVEAGKDTPLELEHLQSLVHCRVTQPDTGSSPEHERGDWRLTVDLVGRSVHARVTDATLAIEQPRVTLKRVTFKGTGDAPHHDALARWATVTLTRAAEGCVLEQVSVHDSRGRGVRVQGATGVELRECLVLDSEGAGIVAHAGAKVLIRGGHVLGSEEAGVEVHDRAQVWLRNKPGVARITGMVQLCMNQWAVSWVVPATREAEQLRDDFKPPVWLCGSHPVCTLHNTRGAWRDRRQQTDDRPAWVREVGGAADFGPFAARGGAPAAPKVATVEGDRRRRMVAALADMSDKLDAMLKRRPPKYGAEGEEQGGAEGAGAGPCESATAASPAIAASDRR